MVASAKMLFKDPVAYREFIFQHDNDPKHTSKVVQRYLKTKGVNVLPWPAQSPDLNPIENLWAILDTRLKHRKCNNEDELFGVLKAGWEALDPQILKNLVDSMSRRCQAVIDAKGMPTKY